MVKSRGSDLWYLLIKATPTSSVNLFISNCLSAVFGWKWQHFGTQVCILCLMYFMGLWTLHGLFLKMVCVCKYTHITGFWFYLFLLDIWTCWSTPYTNSILQNFYIAVDYRKINMYFPPRNTTCEFLIMFGNADNKNRKCNSKLYLGEEGWWGMGRERDTETEGLI